MSTYDEERACGTIKTSGVSYETMTPDDMVEVDLNGNRVRSVVGPAVRHAEACRSFFKAYKRLKAGDGVCRRDIAYIPEILHTSQPILTSCQYPADLD